MAKLESAQTVKTLIDAYAAGVRGGVLTPCLQDENEFRKLLGLPDAPDAVVAEWGRSDGVRLPITLQKGLAEPEDSTQEESNNE